MQKLINLGYGLEWTSCHECEFMSTRFFFFICPGALQRLLFENVSVKLYNYMKSAQHCIQLTVEGCQEFLNVREGNERRREVKRSHMDLRGLPEDAPFERGQNSGSSGQQRDNDYHMLTG